MEKAVNAVFYNFKYYILPEAYADLSCIKDGDEIKAKRLKEELCMAPDFIYESIAEEVLRVEDAKLLFPVKVNLYSHEEYDEILGRQVDKVCKGCARFIDDGSPSLDGHHREISLEGVCYEREEEDDIPPYARRVFWFYEKLTDRLDELAACIDKGDGKKFDKICKECADWITAPEKFIGGVKDGKYCIYMKAGLESGFHRTLYAYTAKIGGYECNPFARAGWVICPYIEAGALKYRGKIKDKTPIASLSVSEDNENAFDIVVYSKRGSDGDCEKAFNEAYDYLVDKIGEDAVVKCVMSVSFTDNKSGLITAGELAETIAAKFKEFEKDRFPFTSEMSWENSENALPHMRSCGSVTTCSELSAICYNSKFAEDFTFAGIASYAYVYVPATEDETGSKIAVLAEYMSGEDKVPEPLIYKEDFAYAFVNLGVLICMDGEGKVNGVAVDCFIGDDKAFFRFIKILTPVLKNLNARIVVVNDDGVTEYKPGFVIEPTDGGAVN